jgi:hypothetical protein
MKKLIICDKNKEVIKAVKKYLKENGNGIFDSVEVVHGDVVKLHEKRPETRIVTASNPDFSPDGGLDAVLAKKYRWNAREFSWDEHLFYAVSVDRNRKPSRDILLRLAVGVLSFAHSFTPILTGVGTGVGGLEIDIFIEVLRAVLTNLSSANLRWANLSSADLRSADLRWADLSSANLSSAKDQALFADNLTLLRYQKHKMRAFKFVTADMKSPINGSVLYKVGKFVEEQNCNTSELEDCGAGLNVATLEWCVKNNNQGDNAIYLEVEFSPEDIVSIPFQSDGKFRVKKLKVIRKLKAEEIEACRNREVK